MLKLNVVLASFFYIFHFIIMEMYESVKAMQSHQNHQNQSLTQNQNQNPLGVRAGGLLMQNVLVRGDALQQVRACRQVLNSVDSSLRAAENLLEMGAKLCEGASELACTEQERSALHTCAQDAQALGAVLATQTGGTFVPAEVLALLCAEHGSGSALQEMRDICKRLLQFSCTELRMALGTQSQATQDIQGRAAMCALFRAQLFQATAYDRATPDTADSQAYAHILHLANPLHLSDPKQDTQVCDDAVASSSNLLLGCSTLLGQTLPSLYYNLVNKLPAIPAVGATVFGGQAPITAATAMRSSRHLGRSNQSKKQREHNVNAGTSMSIATQGEDRLQEPLQKLEAEASQYLLAKMSTTSNKKSAKKNAWDPFTTASDVRTDGFLRCATAVKKSAEAAAAPSLLTEPQTSNKRRKTLAEGPSAQSLIFLAGVAANADSHDENLQNSLNFVHNLPVNIPMDSLAIDAIVQQEQVHDFADFEYNATASAHFDKNAVIEALHYDSDEFIGPPLF
jgi:hypothetical protein